jgi:hypothetical protein
MRSFPEYVRCIGVQGSHQFLESTSVRKNYVSASAASTQERMGDAQSRFGANFAFCSGRNVISGWFLPNQSISHKARTLQPIAVAKTIALIANHILPSLKFAAVGPQRTR